MSSQVPYGAQGIHPDPVVSHVARVVAPGTAISVPRPVAADSLLMDLAPQHQQGPFDLGTFRQERLRARFLALRDPNYIHKRSGEWGLPVIPWRPSL